MVGVILYGGIVKGKSVWKMGEWGRGCSLPFSQTLMPTPAVALPHPWPISEHENHTLFLNPWKSSPEPIRADLTAPTLGPRHLHFR